MFWRPWGERGALQSSKWGGAGVAVLLLFGVPCRGASSALRVRVYSAGAGAGRGGAGERPAAGAEQQSTARHPRSLKPKGEAVGPRGFARAFLFVHDAEKQC